VSAANLCDVDLFNTLQRLEIVHEQVVLMTNCAGHSTISTFGVVTNLSHLPINKNDKPGRLDL
jgi:hypothetical protein